MAILEGRNLRKTYRLSRKNTVEALKGVEVMIEKGEMVAIMGPSGSGKSTLMHILGLLHAPDANHGPAPELYLGGENMASLSDNARTKIRARRMGFVFQDFNLVPTLTALENVTLACDYAGIGGKQAKEAGVAALALVGLADRAGHKPSELSGGEQQRVAIARALVLRPTVMFADEPTGNLDSHTGDAILQLFRKLSEEGRTIVLVTHDPEIAAVTPRRIEIRDGKIATQIDLTLAGLQRQGQPPGPAVPAGT
jgi:putative ABC transport system ATP-binding protein